MVFSWISGAGSPGIRTEYAGREEDKNLFKQAVSATRTNHAEMKATIELTRKRVGCKGRRHNTCVIDAMV